jgi:hypothetical protein
MLNALWIVLLGMLITFAAMGIILLIITILDRIPAIGGKKE